MWGGDTILAAKAALAAVCGIVTIVLARSARLYCLDAATFDRGAIAALALSRLGLFGALFFALGLEPTGDVHAYTKQGELILSGKVVYSDFNSTYSALFPYLVAAVLSVWNSAKALVLVAIGLELASLPIWIAVARRSFSDRTARTATILYVTSPLALLNVAMYGHNNIWHALLFAVALWLLGRRDDASAAAFSLAALVSKFLSLLFAPILWLFAKSRTRWTLGFALVYGGINLGFFSRVGTSLFWPVLYQGEELTSGNLIYLASAFGVPMEGDLFGILTSALLIAALVIVFLTFWARGLARDPSNVFHLILIVLAVFFLTSKKAYQVYWVMALYPVCLSLAARELKLAALGLYALFGVLATVEMPLWFRWMDNLDLSLIWDLAARPPGLTPTMLAVFTTAQIALALAYVAAALHAWGAAESPGPLSTD